MESVWSSVVYVIGAAVEISGIMIMSRKYINFLPIQIPGVLLSALWRGRKARMAIKVIDEGWIVENNLESLQGLALLAFGFFIKSTPEIWHIFAVLLGDHA